MTNSEWAAWVQAIGAVVALFVTAYIARSDRTSRAALSDQAAARIARDHAVTLFPEMKMWMERCSDEMRCLDHDDQIGIWIVLSSLGEEPAWFELPAGVAALNGRFHALGTACSAMQDAVISQHRLEDLRPKLVDLSIRGRDGQHIDEARVDEFERLMRNHCAAVFKAYGMLQIIYVG
jgi:hypothetical protein